MNKKVSVKVWVLVLSIVVAIGLIFAAFFISKAIYTAKSSDFNDFSKWGMTLKYKGDKDANDYHIKHTETNDSLTVEINGSYTCPVPGHRVLLDCLDIFGKNNKALSMDFTGTISFPVGAYIKDKSFYCPLVFHIGKDAQGNPIIIDGSNYIGKKQEFEKTLNEALSNNDAVNIQPGKDAKVEFDLIDDDYFVEFPQDKTDIYPELKNATYDLMLKYDVKEIK